MEKLLKEIEKLSLHEKKSLLERMVKLQEECGELAEEVLIFSKSSGTSHKKSQEGIKAESIDVIIVALSIFFLEKGSAEEFLSLIEQKLEKWKKHQG